MHKSSQDIFKRISYIEADIEIQKQILFSIPSDQKDEIEEVLKIIAKAKDDIKYLHSELERSNPEEFELLSRIEQSVATFKKISSSSTFKNITNIGDDANCALNCKDGRTIQCLVKACDSKGNWTIISLDGILLKIPSDEVIT